MMLFKNPGRTLSPSRSVILSVVLFFILLLFHPAYDLHAQNLRVEPPSWWVGMKNQNLQLMIYGDSIAFKKPSFKYPGVGLKKITPASNPNYLFLDLFIERSALPGKIKIKLGRDTTIEYTLEKRTTGSSSRVGFNSTDAIYLITPDRFANGDASNDASLSTIEKPNHRDKNGRHGGDIKGIQDHLDYIKDLGFTAIWNTPLLENNMNSTSYHGYAITDFYKIDPRFGDNESFRQLTKEAKTRGIKLIWDVVLNHCGDNHWWMKDLPFKDWINFGGQYINTSHRRETHQDPYASKYDLELMTAGWFVPTMPDLNPRNTFLATYLIQNTIWWIEYADLGGLRIDTYPYVDKGFSSLWSKSILAEYPNFNMVGEEWTMNPLTISYWQRGKKNTDGYVSYLPAVMDFPLNQALVQGLNESDATFGAGWTKLYQSLANDFVYPNPMDLVIFPDNHDMNRFYTQIKENFEFWKLGMVFTATTRGIPEFFYGTEVLLTNPDSDSDGERRADFPGGWPGDQKNAFTGKGLSAKEAEAQQFLKRLLNLRKVTPAFQKGKLIQFVPDKGVYVYFRILDKDQYLIILNKNPNAVDLDPTRFEEMIKGTSSFKDMITETTVDLAQALRVDPKSFRILKF